MIHIGPNYHAGAFMPPAFAGIVNWALPIVEEVQADAIAASGLSGLILAGALSLATGKPVIAVRRANEQSHSYDDVCGAFQDDRVTRYIIIDDLIASGATIRRIIGRITHRVEKRQSLDAECVGVLLYNDSGRSDRKPLGETIVGEIEEASGSRDALVFIKPFAPPF